MILLEFLYDRHLRSRLVRSWHFGRLDLQIIFIIYVDTQSAMANHMHQQFQGLRDPERGTWLRSFAIVYIGTYLDEQCTP